MRSAALLRAAVNHLLAERITVAEFAERFYTLYLDLPENDGLSDAEADLFSEIHEKLDWTDVAPDAQSRRDGWIDEAEYLAYVRALVQSSRV